MPPENPEGIKMLPKEFFVTSGKGVSPVSELNAYDLALKSASIAQYNIVPVSSIIPPNCKERKAMNLPVGQIAFTVMARMDGTEGECIGAGIVWAMERSKKYGLVAEAHGHMDRPAVKEILEWKIGEMAKVRGIVVGKLNHRIEVMRVPMDHYGCVITALVLLP
jgi:arginine decarboxylase